MRENELRTMFLDETHRVKVFVDDDTTCPRGDWEMSTGAVSVNVDSRTMLVPSLFEFPGNIHAAYERLWGVGSECAGWGDDWATIARWARIFHGITVVYDGGTFWWVDPAKFAESEPVGEFAGQPLYRGDVSGRLISKAEYERLLIDSEIKVYRQWAEGEVFGLVVEEFKLKVKVHVGIDRDGELISLDEFLPSGDAEDYWNETESVWGFYIDGWNDEEVRREACSIAGLDYAAKGASA